MAKRVPTRQMPPGLGQPIAGKGNPTHVPNRDPSLERTVRSANFRSWYPFYHFRRYFGDASGLNPGQQLVAEITQSPEFRFFVDVPRDLSLCNLKQDGQLPFPFDAYGIGLIVKGDEVFNQETNPAEPFIGQSFRQLLVEHTRLSFTFRDATRIIDHSSVFMMPGLGVSGGVSTTSNDTDRMQDVHGTPHPSAFFRFGGPDRGELEQLNKTDLIEASLHFDEVAVATLAAWFPDESPQVPKLALEFGPVLYGWTHRKVF